MYVAMVSPAFVFATSFLYSAAVSHDGTRYQISGNRFDSFVQVSGVPGGAVILKEFAHVKKCFIYACLILKQAGIRYR